MTFILFKVFWILRFILTLIPQIGYIHPDEHFQGPEAVYGDILNLKVLRTWDFTTEKPIRNIVFPYLVNGPISFTLSTFGIESLQETNCLPYLLLVLPRVAMCCISYLNDLLLFKMCDLTKQNRAKLLTVFLSSHVALVYLTRTFSNCLEVLFFSLVVYLVMKLLNLKSGKGISSMQNAFNASFMLGLIIAMGIFNRPTFVCFALTPITIFVFVLLKQKKFKKKLYCFLSFILGGISITLSFITVDSLYYNKIHFSNMHRLFHNFIITPLNFILYNANKSNLDIHGTHPYWLHAFVNVPLLFSVYGVLLLLQFPQFMFKIFKKWTLSPKDFLSLSFVVPLILLSIIPHQEPRFLLPLIIPLTLLFNDSYFYRFISKRNCAKLWYCHNILGILFYGFLHQSGVYLSSAFIHSDLQNNKNSVIAFYKTYMPPRYLIGLDKGQEDINIYDFAGTGLDDFILSLNDILEAKPSTVYIATTKEMADSVLKLYIFRSKYKMLTRKVLFPHLSTEHLPNLKEIQKIISSTLPFLNKLYKIKKLLSIHVLIFKNA